MSLYPPLYPCFYSNRWELSDRKLQIPVHQRYMSSHKMSYTTCSKIMFPASYLVCSVPCTVLPVCIAQAQVQEPVRLVRFWLDHFFGDLINFITKNCTCAYYHLKSPSYTPDMAPASCFKINARVLVWLITFYIQVYCLPSSVDMHSVSKQTGIKTTHIALRKQHPVMCVGCVGLLAPCRNNS